MLLAIQQQTVLPAWVPWPVVLLLAAAGAAAWVLLHRPAGRPGQTWLRVLLAVVRTGAGFVTLLALAAAAARAVLLTTNWPVWPIALGGAAAVEVVVALYGLERRTVSKATAAVLVACRVGLVLLVVAMLLQPVHWRRQTQRQRRTVAILADESASMFIPDTQLTPAEKLRLAECLSVPAARRPWRVDAEARTLQRVGEAFGREADRLEMVGNDDPEALGRRVTDAQKRLDALAATIAEVLKGVPQPTAQVRAGLLNVKARLSDRMQDRLTEAAKVAQAGGGAKASEDSSRLLRLLRQLGAELTGLAPTLASLADAMDAALYRSLPERDRISVDVVARRHRHRLAREVLTHRPITDFARQDSSPSLLSRLSRYDLKLYRFAASPEESDLGKWTRADGPMAAALGEAAALPASQLRTDLAAALRKVMADLSGESLAGILVVTDGRHNSGEKVAPIARRLGATGAAVCSIVFGSQRGPTDAAVASVEAPDTVYIGDKLLVTAELKLDGLAGRTVRVALMRGKEQVDVKTVKVPAATFPTQVELSDTPADAGLQPYLVRIDPLDGEVLVVNNDYPLTVSVTKDRIHLLLIEGRPRWEFRYLKNLFAGRDVSVRLQYVLLEPDRIAGLPPKPSRPASVLGPPDEAEATALPASEGEWMKFDVVILGDVSPGQLGREHVEALGKFVSDRGGTLVVIAGPRYMPHAHAGTALAEILPVLVDARAGAVVSQAEESFRVALTTEGEESPILRQRIDREANRALWEAMPPLHWRRPIVDAKPAATVLAYAMPPSPPSYAKAGPDEAEAPRRRQFQRRRALISLHDVGLGRVMFLGFDRTWRLRYRVGDTYHHKFWGQVLRWATAGELPGGTDLVRLGTDRARYEPDSDVRVRAKIVRRDFSAVVTDQVAVNVHAGHQFVLRRPLHYVPDSPGLYEGRLGSLAGGTYRVELDCPEARGILAAENIQTVSAEFAVKTAAPVEQIELAADRGLLEQLALLTGGVAVPPPQADQVLAAFGPASLTRQEEIQHVVWNSWPLLMLIVLAATAEWLVRKKVGLA